jgi:hypothetical protein
LNPASKFARRWSDSSDGIFLSRFSQLPNKKGAIRKTDPPTHLHELLPDPENELLLG